MSNKNVHFQPIVHSFALMHAWQLLRVYWQVPCHGTRTSWVTSTSSIEWTRPRLIGNSIVPFTENETVAWVLNRKSCNVSSEPISIGPAVFSDGSGGVGEGRVFAFCPSCFDCISIQRPEIKPLTNLLNEYSSVTITSEDSRTNGSVGQNSKVYKWEITLELRPPLLETPVGQLDKRWEIAWQRQQLANTKLGHNHQTAHRLNLYTGPIPLNRSPQITTLSRFCCL